MNGDDRKDRSAQPLKGAVICCTSVPAEQRTQYAGYALQMGADHKLDLTSDVTHLLVGDANTPKYKYVAREREDVKVLRPEWIEAVRDAWMGDVTIDLNALEAQYKLPTFAGLTICITGFDDLTFRAHLQQKIDEAGGTYTGDLTKYVTHLIAYKAEGKKYQYALQWQKQIVTLQWLKDSLERGMQLDETKYHPSIPPDDQGKGAWNREAKHATQLGKRSRPKEAVVEPSRKLRRTASARFSGQNNEFWADINGNAGNEQPKRDALRPSKSMPLIQPHVERGAGHDNPAHLQTRNTDSDGYDDPARQPRLSELSHGFLDGCYFSLSGFNERKTEILRGIVLGQGGTMLESLDDLDNMEYVTADKCFLIVPHDIGATVDMSRIRGRCQVVTELWVEICMDRKECVVPSTYPLGNLLRPLNNVSPGNGNPQRLSVNSSGFPGIQRNHVAKAIHAIGGTYEEVLKAGVSVLICYSAGSSLEKIRHAAKWKVPIVNPDWLWASLDKGVVASFNAYTLDSNIPLAHVETTRNILGKDLAAKERPGSDFSEARSNGVQSGEDSSASQARALATHARSSKSINNDSGSARKVPLQVTSGNSPSTALLSSPKKKEQLYQTLDGAASTPENVHSAVGAEAEARPAGTNLDVQHPGLLNGAIQDLLKQNARTKSLTSSASAVQKNKQPLSRALSNVSCASLGSRAGASRAGSVSSVNTDGLGSEIAVESAEMGRAASSNRARGSFTGRAKARDERQTIRRASSIDLNNPGLCDEAFVEEELPQQLTQLGYEDPAEAVALRAKLEEKRRKRSEPRKDDQGIETSEKKARPAPHIRDDDLMLDVGWAGRRRTRHKERTSPALQGLNDF